MSLTRRALLGGSLLVASGCAASGDRGRHPAASQASSGSSSTAGVSPSATPSAGELAPLPEPSPPPTPEPTSDPPSTALEASAPPQWQVTTLPDRAQLVAEFAGREPGQFGTDVAGVVTRLPNAAGVALTFDACGGGGGGTGYDADLIATLRTYAVPATLFLNHRWVVANPDVAAELAADPLFEIESHGVRHRPLSMTGRSAYGIGGTLDAGDVYDELTGDHQWFLDTLGRPPWFFRSGTAHVDEASAAMARRLGRPVLNFSVNADSGATAPASRVAQQLRGAGAGDIVIGHLNRPGRGTAAGVAQVLPELLGRGVSFVQVARGF